MQSCLRHVRNAADAPDHNNELVTRLATYAALNEIRSIVYCR